MEIDNPSNFEKFLIENRHKQVEKRSFFSSLFSIRGDIYSLFLPGSWDDKNGLQPPDSELAYKPKTPVPEALERARVRFGSLPSGYCTFISILGTGSWAKAIMRHPDHLSELDGLLSGFVQVADNVDEDGGCVMFNLKDMSSNQKMYYGSVEPFGYTFLADSFEQWIYRLTTAWLNEPNSRYAVIYTETELVELDPRA